MYNECRLIVYMTVFVLQVNVGCVPKKVMFNTAMHAEMIHDHKDYGFDVELKQFDWRFEPIYKLQGFISRVSSQNLRMVYLYSISCVRYTILVRNPRFCQCVHAILT